MPRKTLVKEGYKVCSQCKQELPEDAKYFVKATNTKSGLGAMCRKCKHEKYMEKREHYINKSRKYYAENREVILSKSNEYRIQNKQHKKEYDKKYREVNKDKIKKRLKMYYEENKEKLNLYNKSYYQQNKDAIKEVNRKWKFNNLDKVRLSRKRRKNKWKELKADLTLQDWEYAKDYFGNACAYCGEKQELEQDHFVPVSKGGEYTKANIIPSCRSCNASKNNSDFCKWYKTKDFYSKDREEKIIKYLMEV